MISNMTVSIDRDVTPCQERLKASPEMVPMYLLMSAFHSAPWLKLVSRQRSDALRP